MPDYNQSMNIVVNDNASDKIVEINSRLREMKSLVHDINRGSAEIKGLFSVNGWGGGAGRSARLAVKNDKSRVVPFANRKNNTLQHVEELDKEIISVSKSFLSIVSATTFVTKAFQKVTSDAEKAAQALGQAASSAKKLGLNTSSSEDAAYASDRRIRQLDNASKNAMATSAAAMTVNEIKQNFFPGIAATLFGDGNTEFRYNMADMQNVVNSGVGNLVSSGTTKQNALAMAQNLAGVAVGAYGSDRFGSDPTAFTQALLSAVMGNADAVGQYGLYADENYFTGWMANRGYDIANVQYSDAFLAEQRYAMLLDEINTIMSDPTGQMTVDSLSKSFRQMGMEIQNCKQQLYGFDEVINQTGLITDDVTIHDEGFKPSTTLQAGLDAGKLYKDVNDTTKKFMSNVGNALTATSDKTYKTLNELSKGAKVELQNGIDGIKTYLVATENAYKLVITNDMGVIIAESEEINEALKKSGELTDDAKDKLVALYESLGLSDSDAKTAAETSSKSLTTYFKTYVDELKGWLADQILKLNGKNGNNGVQPPYSTEYWAELQKDAAKIYGLPTLEDIKNGRFPTSLDMKMLQKRMNERDIKNDGTETKGGVKGVVTTPVITAPYTNSVNVVGGPAISYNYGYEAADGGLFTSEVRNVTVGEAGREAILPLESQLGIDALSTALEQAGAGQNITVNLYAGSIIDTSSKTRKELAQMVANEINYLSSKRGGLLK